jgi:hypothetical protein
MDPPSLCHISSDPDGARGVRRPSRPRISARASDCQTVFTDRSLGRVGDPGVAPHAVQRRTEEARAPLGGRHPLAVLPRRVVTHVLAMSAVEIRDPMTFIIPVEPDNATIHVAVSGRMCESHRRAQDWREWRFPPSARTVAGADDTLLGGGTHGAR